MEKTIICVMKCTSADTDEFEIFNRCSAEGHWHDVGPQKRDAALGMIRRLKSQPALLRLLTSGANLELES